MCVSQCESQIKQKEMICARREVGTRHVRGRPRAVVNEQGEENSSVVTDL